MFQNDEHSICYFKDNSSQDYPDSSSQDFPILYISLDSQNWVT